MNVCANLSIGRALALARAFCLGEANNSCSCHFPGKKTQRLANSWNELVPRRGVRPQGRDETGKYLTCDLLFPSPPCRVPTASRRPTIFFGLSRPGVEEMRTGSELLDGGLDGDRANPLGRRKLELSDTDLLRSAAQGDGAAFHRLVDRHAAGLYRVARSLSASEHDAEDVLQETFLAAHRGAAGFDGRASVKTWLQRILMRQAARAWNRERRSRAALPLDTADPPVHAGGGAVRVDQRIDLAAVLETLPPDHRQVLVLREVEQLSYAEIARVLNVPIGTVDSRLHRARREMRQRLEEYAQ